MKGYSVVASRYAEALFGLAVEQGEKANVQVAMQGLSKVYDESPEWRAFLRNPVVPIGKKKEVVQAMFAHQVPALVQLFLDKLVSSRREMLLGEIAEAYEVLHLKYEGILVAEVKSASALSDAQKVEVMSIVKNASFAKACKEVRLVEKIEPQLIGGLVVRVGDREVDASIARKLADLRQQFSSNLYTPKI